MKYCKIILILFFAILFGNVFSNSQSCDFKFENTIPSNFSKYDSAKYDIDHNYFSVLEENNIELEEECDFKHENKNFLSLNFLQNSLSIVSLSFEKLFDLNIYNNYFKNVSQIIFNHNPLYLTQSVFLI